MKKLIEQYELIIKMQHDLLQTIIQKRKNHEDTTLERNKIYELMGNRRKVSKLLLQEFNRILPMEEYIKYGNVIYVVGKQLGRIDLNTIKEIK